MGPAYHAPGVLRLGVLLTTALGLVWGLAQGVRHALEPDHLAAMSTLVAERRTARSAASYAAAWGIGHAFVLLLVGGVLLAVRAQMPAGVARLCELGVAVMLVLLGARALRLAVVARSAEPRHASGVHVARLPLLVGSIHGLAGSGALTALVLTRIGSPLVSLVYIALYGGGAALGMATLAGLAGAPMARLARARRGMPVLLATTGALSMCLGVAWGWSAR